MASGTRLQTAQSLFMAEFHLTQCNMTDLDYGRRIGGHEHRTPTLTKNRNSQVPGDLEISSGGEFRGSQCPCYSRVASAYALESWIDLGQSRNS